MNKKFLFILAAVLNVTISSTNTYGQSQVENSNGTPIIAIVGIAPTRIGSPDGPVAGENILAQLRAGTESDSLQPAGVPVPHVLDNNGNATGFVRIQTEIPFIPEGSSGGYAQVAVWDSHIWGGNYTEVPNNQFGYTEILEFRRSSDSGGAPLPMVSFKQVAIVPNVPEPEIMSLLLGVWFASIIKRQINKK